MHVCEGLDDLIMMGFHAASGLVSVISASHSRDYCVVLLFTVLFSNSNLYVYIEDGIL